MAIPTWVDEVEFAAGDADITEFGRDKVGWTSMRGTTSIVQTGFIPQAGQLSQSLSNTDRRFDPLYASGAYFPDVLPGVAFEKIATWAATPHTVFTGKVDEWPQSYPGTGIDQVVDLRVSDGVKAIAEAEQVTLTRPAEYPGQRIEAILEAIGYQGGYNLARGDVIVGPIRRNQGSISAWSHITDCVNAQWGEAFVGKEGEFVFRDWSDIVAAADTPSATFSDTTALKYSDITMANLPIVNDCTVTYGTRGRTVHVSDATSIDTYGVRSLPLTLILHDRSTAKQYAKWIVARYKDPKTVPASIVIKPGANPTTYFPQVLGRELCEVITVVRTPKVNGVASTPISSPCFIRGIQHSYSDHVWQSTTFYLQDASWATGVFILDTSELDGPDVLW